MSTKHTQGPWTASETPEKASRDRQVFIILHPHSDVSNTIVAEVYGKENATLVAASPRMAKVLQTAARLLAELPPAEQGPQMLALRSEIVATIKEATPEYYGLDKAKEV